MKEGVLVGCDQRQEWLLKWWWERYKEENDYPVAFCDFGMSPGAKAWCKSKGMMIEQLPKEIKKINFSKVDDNAPWLQRIPSYLWDRRAIWLTKPFTFPMSPFDKTIWIDLDCHVKKSLKPLFTLPLSSDGFAISLSRDKATREAQFMQIIDLGVQALQTGVIVFTKDSPILKEWLERTVKNFYNEFSEETILSHIAHEEKYAFTYFSNDYNWTTPDKPNPNATIIHYAGPRAKRQVMEQISAR